eukprot:scpid20838/ scgid30223/ 
METPLIQMVVFLALLFASDEVRSACTKLDACSCRDSASGKVISLGALASGDGTPAVNITAPMGKYRYSYNPCLPFTVRNGTQCVNVAMCQRDTQQEIVPGLYNLGNQSSAEFVSNGTELYLHYEGSTTDSGAVRMTRIQLICDTAATVPDFRFVRESQVGRYEFTMRTRCACPGECEEFHRECKAEGSAQCACRLTDGQLINIRSLNQPSAPLVVKTDEFSVTLNPCTGIDVGPGTTQCRDVTVCMQRQGAYLDYGIAERANYSLDVGQVTLSYTSRDGSRSTEIKLVCDQGQRHYPQVLVVNEPTSSLLKLEMRSVCACPGACLSPPVTCERVDDCTCRLADGAGTFSLHDLDNPVAPLTATSSNGFTTFKYYYNPCTKFTAPEPNDNCTDVAVCQIDAKNAHDFSLGTQSGVSYRVSADTDAVSFHYIGGDSGRQTYVQLQCSTSADIPVLHYVDEKPANTYHFALESKTACSQHAERDPFGILRKGARTRV